MITLAKLLAPVGSFELAPSETGLTITGVTSQSSRVQPGFLFVAKKGATAHSKNGHDFIDDAIQRGAAAIVVEHGFLPAKPLSLPVITVSKSEEAYALLCEAFYGFPSQKLSLIGITGTNGKTSTSFMLHGIFKAAGFTPKIMGTLGMGDPGHLLPLSHTTMEAEFISRALAHFVDEGITHVIMEVSSHALALHRADALDFTAVGLTNITQDHLDFHETLEEYTAAKALLFWRVAKPHTYKILPTLHPFKNTDQLENLILYDAHELITDQLPFLGDFHQQNACLAASLASCLGVAMDTIKKGLHQCQPVPGRLELVTNNPCPILVDFAHTPDALKSVLTTVKRLTQGRLILVMGCGGDRDSTKRPLMGRIAEEWADQIIVTDDNPRHEDPQVIREQILAGMREHSKVKNIGNRSDAIYEAIKNAGPDDIVLITGKGHEEYQIYGDNKRPFSDQMTSKKAAETLWQK